MMRNRLRQAGRDERGVVLVMVAVMMIMMLAAAAIAIDVGSWYQTQKQVQNTADAAALAGAQDLPNTTTATTDAQTYVSKNITGATVAITFPSGKIQVRVTATASTFFAGALGITAPQVGATAVAKNTGRVACATPGSNCWAIFAMDSSCASTPITLGGGDHVSGGIYSNGSINVGGGGSSYGPTTYGNGSGCTVLPSGYQTQANTFTSGPSQGPVIGWPIDFTVDFPSCSGASCTGPGGTPSFCTQSTTATNTTLQDYNPVNLTSGDIYCDVGTGTASNPSTWNGNLTVNQTGVSPVKSSFVAGTVYIGGGSDLIACGYTSTGYSAAGCDPAVPTPPTGNYPLIYATRSGTSVNESSGGGNLIGDVFAPNGTINIGGGTATQFVEGRDVIDIGGALTGDGPSYSGGVWSSAGTALIQ